MSVVFWIILGGVAGWLASLTLRSDHTAIEDIILGMAGGFVGGFIVNSIGFPWIMGINAYSFLVALTGAIGVIFLGRLLHR